MHKDLEEIKKIATVLPKKKCSKKNVCNVLDKICFPTDEISRSEKYDDYQKNCEELKDCLKDKFGEISNNCIDAKCNQCSISKWCNYYREQEQKRELRRKGLTYADFFCGAGGLSWGFHRAGFKMSLANDIQECCVDTISLNHPEVPEKHVIAGDINSSSGT